MNVQIETTKYFSVERFQSFKILENSTIMQGFSNPYIALIGRNPFRACFFFGFDFMIFHSRWWYKLGCKCALLTLTEAR